MARSRKSQYGQHNTCRNECEFTLNNISKFVKIEGDVIEPSFGTGNFIDELKKHNVSIDAYEIDPLVYKNISGVNTYNSDFLFEKIEKKYDFVVGNPPYIELTYSFYNDEQRQTLKKLYSTEGRGRVNLVHLFLDKSFCLIKENGIIAFLLPSTILTSPWYNDIRKKIYEQFTVLDIIENIPFRGVSISICLLILQNKFDETHKNIESIDGFYTLTKNKRDQNKRTLKQMGFECRVGDILWYNVKDKLRDKSKNAKTLVYTNNIKFGSIDTKIKLKSKIEGKKQFIVGYNEPMIENCIVTPRVIGKKMKHHLILNNEKFVFENHVLIITHKDVEKLKELNEIMSSNTQSFREFFNSSQLTSAELLNFSY